MLRLLKQVSTLLLLVWAVSSWPALAMFNDDPWLTKVAPEFEIFQSDGESVLEWDVDAWTGRDLTKFWMKTAGEYADSEIEHAMVELVFSRAVSTYWDQQFGIRQDITADDDENERKWLSFGYIGSAAYFIDVDARLFVGEDSSTQLLVELEREFMLTQEWVFTSELDVVANGRSNLDYGEGSGLAEMELALTLGYERDGNRHLKPFAGVSTKREFGATRSISRSRGAETSDTKFIVGVEFWF